MVGVPVNSASVGSCLSLFVAQSQWQTITRGSVANHHSRPLYYFNSDPRVSEFNSRQFSGGVTGSHRTPTDPKAHLAICKEIQEFILLNAIVQIDDFPLLCLSPIFVIPKKTGSPRCFESENQYFHFGTTLQNVNPQCHSADSARSRLGNLDLSKGRLPSCTGSPPVQETVGFKIPRQDLRVQGLAFRPKILSVGLFECSSYSRSSPSPAGHPDILLSGRLASDGGVPVASPGPRSSHSSVVPEVGVHRQLEEIGAHPSEDARLPSSFSRYSKVDCSSGRSQSGGSLVAHSGTYRVSGSSCFSCGRSS